MTTETEIEEPRITRIFDTLPSLVYRNFDQWADETAMCQKKLGVWQKYTWRPYYDAVRQFSLGLVSLGMARGDIVCLTGDNKPEWFWSEFAVQAAGGIAAGIPVSTTSAGIKAVANHCGAKFAFAANREQIEKFQAVRSDLPFLKKIIYCDSKGMNGAPDPLLISFAEVQQMGVEYEKTNPGLFEQNMNYVTGDNIAFIAYTIGSDGRPAGISLTHQALINSGRGLLERFVIRGEDNLIPGLLPAEANNACFAVAPHLLTGAILNFPEKPETTAHDIREINPDFVTYSPQQWENLAAQIRTKIGRSNPFMAVGYKFADCKMQNKKPNILWRLLHIPASLLFFRPLRNQFGLRRVRCAAVNGQIADLETFRLLHAAGIPLRQSYALTETGLTACQGRDDITFENAGRPSVNTELRITAQNELLVRNSSMFNGYHNDPQKTAAVLIDGWYHTGIAANIDGKGHLIILNRNSTQAK